ncbi:MAG: hypothetical protein MZV70_69875 [Desulfobacterales bacterium]|nr:hypothetical protein [Desulfobacterales bacterium]
MISEIQGSSPIYYPSKYDNLEMPKSRPLHNFDIEDKAIISAQAKLLNELEKFNSGQGDVVDLAVTSIKSEQEVAANVKVINTKNHMLDAVMGIVD